MTGRDRCDGEVPIERLWLGVLHELGRPVAHELRNALNGVSVNLEVVRGRAARADAPAASVARFADAAVDQLDTLAALTDALLALVRPVAEPADLAQLLARLGTLLGATTQAEGGALVIRVTPADAPVRTGVPGEQLRTLVAGLLLGALERGTELDCELVVEATPRLRLRRANGVLPDLPPDVAALAGQLRVRLDGGPDGWNVEFPAAG
jgi:signal transduction histidine kinase